MTIYTTPAGWEERLVSLASKPHHEAIISTFNLFLDGGKVEDALTKLNEVGRTKILVGLPYYAPCCNWKEGPCPPCTKKREHLLDRIVEASLKYPRIQWFYTYEWHLKTYLIKMGTFWTGMFGGVNLSASNWTDALIDVHGTTAQQLSLLVKKTIDTSPLITKEELAINGYRKRN